MASSIMSIGHLQRRRPSLDAVSTVEGAIAAVLVVTLTISAALVFFAGRTSDDAGQVTVLAPAPVVDQAPVASAEGASFVESGDAAGAVETSSDASAVEANIADGAAAIEAFKLERGDVEGLYITLGHEPVNLRSEPGVSASIVGQIEPGDGAMAFSAGRLEAVGSDVWMEVEYLGTTGWVRADLLQPTDAH